MAQPLSTDIRAPFDPTGYASITGAQLLQYLTGAFPQIDKGLVVVTEDVAGVPEVPDAEEETKWQNYIWLRKSVTSVAIYLWNDGGTEDATFLKWVTAFSASIAAGSIQGYQIANNTITDGNISNVNWSKITGAPSSIASGSAAGGDLTGTYPSPSVASLAITSAKIALNAVKGGASNQLATGADGATLANNIAPTASSTLGSPSGGSAGASAANDRVVLGVGATAYATVRKVIDSLAEPAGADALKSVRVNSTGNGYVHTNDGNVLQKVAKVVSAGVDITTVIPYDNTIPQNTEGDQVITLSFTPKSATSLLHIKFSAMVTSTNNPRITMALFVGAGADAVSATTALGAGANDANFGLALDFVMASPGTSAVNIAIRVGPDANTANFNKATGAQIFSTAMKSFLIVEEFMGTLS